MNFSDTMKPGDLWRWNSNTLGRRFPVELHLIIENNKEKRRIKTIILNSQFIPNHKASYPYDFLDDRWTKLS